jgi:hypothetical protein
VLKGGPLRRLGPFVLVVASKAWQRASRMTTMRIDFAIANTREAIEERRFLRQLFRASCESLFAAEKCGLTEPL